MLGDINRRRGQITGMDERGGSQVLRAHVPLAEMFGYVNDLRSMTSGRASYTMEFSHYEEVPRSIAEEIKAKSAGKVGAGAELARAGARAGARRTSGALVIGRDAQL